MKTMLPSCYISNIASSKKLTACKARKAIKKGRHLRHVKRKTIKAHKTLWHVRHVKKGRHVGK